jgi:hypothetical protein
MSGNGEQREEESENEGVIKLLEGHPTARPKGKADWKGENI